ncbi:MAG: hypothetical protein KatS3mg004_2935 [Bryobacteraceae bacterium]|nr:MAG: hypothetical protein KatS3mg004_2935 [Bryobacteraceae bacterium]
MTRSEILPGLPGYQVIAIERGPDGVRIRVRYVGPRGCPHCGGTRLRSKGRVRRLVRLQDWAQRHCRLEVEAPKAQCLACGRHFRQPLPGILPWQRASEAFRRAIFQQHLDGINRSRLARREGIGAATVQRYFQHGLRRQAAQWQSVRCPKYLGLDEHFFTRRHGYATTLCHLGRHKVFDVVLGRSEASLDAYFQRLEGKAEVELACIDLASHYRALVRKHFPNARIVADRFHVIRLVHHPFLACWRELDPPASRNRGLLSLMRRHSHRLSPPQRERLEQYLAQHPPSNSSTASSNASATCCFASTKPAPSAAASPAASSRPSASSAMPACPSSSSSAKPCLPGAKKSPPCGASPATTPSRKASTLSWSSSTVKPSASETSKTTGCESKSSVVH